MCATHASSCGVGRACSSEGAYSGYPHYLRTNSCAASPTRSRQRRTTRSLPPELTATASTSSSTAIRPIRSTCWRFSACDGLVPLSAKLAGLPYRLTRPHDRARPCHSSWCTVINANTLFPELVASTSALLTGGLDHTLRRRTQRGMNADAGAARSRRAAAVAGRVLPDNTCVSPNSRSKTCNLIPSRRSVSRFLASSESLKMPVLPVAAHICVQVRIRCPIDRPRESGRQMSSGGLQPQTKELYILQDV